eukprot:6190398-Pleurochrysis_carterae.AAC.7
MREQCRLPFTRRAGRRLADYLLYSLPLVICAFAATGERWAVNAVAAMLWARRGVLGSAPLCLSVSVLRP